MPDPAVDRCSSGGGVCIAPCSPLLLPHTQTPPGTSTLTRGAPRRPLAALCCPQLVEKYSARTHTYPSSSFHPYLAGWEPALWSPQHQHLPTSGARAEPASFVGSDAAWGVNEMCRRKRSVQVPGVVGKVSGMDSRREGDGQDSNLAPSQVSGWENGNGTCSH